MTLQLRKWKEAGVSVKLYVSTSGDFVQIGTRTEYPFESGGPNGVPLGWSEYRNGGAVTDVNRSVGIGRFNISNAVAPSTPNVLYGTSRDYPFQQWHRYIFSVQAQTMEGKGNAARYVALELLPGNLLYFGASRSTQLGWEDIVFSTGFLVGNYTQFRVILGAWYAGSLGNTDPNWGIQYQSFSILDQAYDAPPITWKEVTCDTRSLQTRYGRDRFTSRYDVGSFSVGIRNDDGEFSYDEFHPWGLRPGRFIKGTIGIGGSETPLFFGLIDSLTDGYTLDGRAVTVMNCVDISQLLANQTVPSASDGNHTYRSGQRIERIYRSVGWHPDYARSDTGLFIQQPIFDNGRTIRDEIGLCADSEGGYWFAGRDGILQYYDRDWPTREPKQLAVQAQILATPEMTQVPVVDNFPTAPDAPTICANALNVNWSRDRIVNEVQLSNAGGTAKRYINDPSQRKYGVQSYSRMDLVNDVTTSNTEGYLDIRAADIMNGFAEAVLRVNSVTFRPTEEAFDWCKDVFLNDVVRVFYVHPENLWGYAVVTHVQSVEHRIIPDDWEMTLALDQPIAFTRFQWDPTGEYGWDMNLWDLDLWDEFQQESAHWSSGELWSAETTKWG